MSKCIIWMDLKTETQHELDTLAVKLYVQYYADEKKKHS